MANVPTISVQAAWDDAVTGLVVIGQSIISTDTIGGTFAFNSWTNIPECQRVSIRRGRSGNLAQMDAGRCTLTLFDDEGKYNPLNASSSLNGKLVPMRPVRVRATDPTTSLTHTLFLGFILEIEYQADPVQPRAVIQCIDLFEWLDKAYPTISSTTDDCGALIQLILTAIGWTQTALTSIDGTGKSVPSFSSTGTETGLALIKRLLDVDRGLFFVKADGTARYVSHHTLRAVSSAVATFTQAQMEAMFPSVQAQLIVNSQSVTKTDNSAQTARDQDSQESYGQRQGSAITSALLNSDAQAASLAEWLVESQKDPRTPARPVKLKNKADDGTTLTQMLTRELTDIVTLTDNVYGTAVTGYLDQITHEIWDGGSIMETTFLVTKRNVQEIILGTSTIGSAHIVGYGDHNGS